MQQRPALTFFLNHRRKPPLLTFFTKNCVKQHPFYATNPLPICPPLFHQRVALSEVRRYAFFEKTKKEEAPCGASSF
jgi:hypothetical protein